MKFRVCYLFFALFMCCFTLSIQASEHWTDIRDDLTDTLNDTFSTPDTPSDDGNTSSSGDDSNKDQVIAGGTSSCSKNPAGDWSFFNGGGPIPDTAVVGGHNHDRAFIICRANYNGNVMSGRMTASGCAITSNGREYIIPSGQILMGDAYYWADSNNTVRALPSHAIRIGVDNNNSVYVCQGQFNNVIYPGKYENGFCYIAVNAKETPLASYKILCRHDN